MTPAHCEDSKRPDPPLLTTVENAKRVPRTRTANVNNIQK
jgi:hypothetical protein